MILELMYSSPATASTSQCPNLRGEYFCPGVEGSHKDMVMKIKQKRIRGVMNYFYRYEQVGEEVLELKYLASNKGTPNPDHEGIIGKCMDGYYFNTKDGTATPRTLLNYVDEDGAYLVIRNDSVHTIFLRCEARR